MFSYVSVCLVVLGISSVQVVSMVKLIFVVSVIGNE